MNHAEPLIPDDVPTTIVPDIDAIRHAIADAEERARLLRRLLRAAMRLQAHLATSDRERDGV